MALKMNLEVSVDVPLAHTKKNITFFHVVQEVVSGQFGLLLEKKQVRPRAAALVTESVQTDLL